MKSPHETDDDVIIATTHERIPSSSEEGRLRGYKFWKVSKLLNKCRVKNIKFDKHFIDLSYTLLNTPESMMMAQMEELRVECTEALGSDYSSTDSASDSENEHKCQIQKKKKPGLLVAACEQFNPYKTYVFDKVEMKPIFTARGLQFGITSPIQACHLNFPSLGGTPQGLMSFAETFAHRRNEMDFGGPSLSSCSSVGSTSDTSASLTPGHSPLFSANDNLSFQVSYLICCHVKITVILYLIRMLHQSNINDFISRCNILMCRIPVQ